MTLEQFILWLSSAAGAAAAFSFIAERLAAFQAQTPQNKALIHLGGSLAIALAAYAVLTYIPSATLETFKPWFQVTYGVVATWMANQLAHRADPAS